MLQETNLLNGLREIETRRLKKARKFHTDYGTMQNFNRKILKEESRKNIMHMLISDLISGRSSQN